MATHGNRRAPVHAAIDFGLAELRPDAARARGWTLLVDGVPQSYVDLDDPGHLEFPYVKDLGRVIKAWLPGRVRPRVLHLGGGALTLPRLIARLRPDVEQTVVERDAGLITLVERFLPFPKSITVRAEDARHAIAHEQADLIIVDVFQGAAMPAGVSSIAFARATRNALDDNGLLAVNLTDVPPLAHTRIQAATWPTAFAGLRILGPGAVLRGRRAGNVIVLAGDVPMIRIGKHERMIGGADLAEFIGGARPRLDEPG